jgi:hypothetical protein
VKRLPKEFQHDGDMRAAAKHRALEQVSANAGLFAFK